MNLVPCELAQLLIAEQRIAQMVVLREIGGERCLPIEIGIIEAMAINRYVQGEDTVRPMTHDLALKIIEEMGGALQRMVVSDLVSAPDGTGTFYGTLVVAKKGEEVEIDCRPSDGIALATRAGCPILVSEHVLDLIGGQ